MRRISALLGVVAVVLASSGLGAAGARAQQVGGGNTTTTQKQTTTTVRRTTTTTADPEYREPPPPPPTSSTTTTTAKPRDEDGSDPGPPSSAGNPTNPPPSQQPRSSTTTTPRGGGGDDAPATSSSSDGGGDDAKRTGKPAASTGKGAPPQPQVSGADGDGGRNPSTAPREVPAEYKSLISSVRRSRPNSTASLLAALKPLEDLGVAPQKIPLVGMGRFPIGGPATFVDDWWFPRYTPSFHLHQGTDIFAAHGTPVRAPVDGVMRHSNGSVGGLAVYVTQPDGTYFYLAHLAGFVPGQASGQKVKTGDVVGYVGDTGNARGGAPHVHMQIHPRGGGPVNPKPFLDRFLSEAILNVPRLIAAHQGDRPRAVITTGLTRRMSGGAGPQFSAPSTPSRSQLLWATSANPSGGVLRLAEAELTEATRDLDWAALARSELERRALWDDADHRAQVLLAPLTPPALAAYMGLDAAAGVSNLVAMRASTPRGSPLASRSTVMRPNPPARKASRTASS